MARARANTLHPNNEGFYELRSDPQLVAELERRAKAIADGCNEDLGADEFLSGSIQGEKKPFGRWQTSVYTSTSRAMQYERKHKTILKNIDRGRG